MEMMKGVSCRLLDFGARRRSVLVIATSLSLLIGLFQNCHRWHRGIESPRQIYGKEVLLQLGDLEEPQKEGLCQSAANYLCRRLRLGDQRKKPDLTEMVCMDHEVFPRRVCIRTDDLFRSLGDLDVPCENCFKKDGVKGEGVWEEYSCFNAALKAKTLIEYRLYGEDIREALTRTYLSCLASLSFSSSDF